jgi:serine/threonine-protein kinase
MHRVTCRAVALKVTRPRGLDSGEMLLRFLRESQCASALRHPSIVDIYDAGVTGSGVAFIAMELVDGKTLRACFAAADPPAGVEALRLGRAIAEAVSHAHAFNVIHRDLKPENVMLVGNAGSRQVKLVDFGLAAPVKYAEADRVSIAGMVAGTPLYMAPEQALGFPATPAFDVYALGMLLYELMAQKPLRERGTVGERSTPEAALVRARTDLARLVMPAGYAELVAECLSVDPLERPTAGDVAARLAKMPESGWRRKRWSSRAVVTWPVWKLAVLSAAVVVVSIAGAAALVHGWQPAAAAICVSVGATTSGSR